MQQKPKSQSQSVAPNLLGHSTVRMAALLAMAAFFLPWLKIGCVQIDGSVTEEIMSGYKVACGTEILGEELKDHKYWLLLIAALPNLDKSGNPDASQAGGQRVTFRFNFLAAGSMTASCHLLVSDPRSY